MPRRESIELTRRVLAHLEHGTLDVVDDVWFEPREAFVERGRFDADVAMLRTVPHVIGWAGEVSSPGQYTTKDVMGVPAPITTDDERAWYTMGIDGAALVLEGQDFPMAEACQRGLEAGVDHVVFGRNEALLHHLAAAWQHALVGASLQSAT